MAFCWARQQTAGGATVQGCWLGRLPPACFINMVWVWWLKLVNQHPIRASSAAMRMYKKRGRKRRKECVFNWLPHARCKMSEEEKQCCGSGMFIPDPIFSISDPGTRIQGWQDWIQDPGLTRLDPGSRVDKTGSGSASKNLRNFFTKKLILSSQKLDAGCSHPGSQILDLVIFHPRSRIQGSKKNRIPDPVSGSAPLKRSMEGVPNSPSSFARITAKAKVHHDNCIFFYHHLIVHLLVLGVCTWKMGS